MVAKIQLKVSNDGCKRNATLHFYRKSDALDSEKGAMPRSSVTPAVHKVTFYKLPLLR